MKLGKNVKQLTALSCIAAAVLMMLTSGCGSETVEKKGSDSIPKVEKKQTSSKNTQKQTTPQEEIGVCTSKDIPNPGGSMNAIEKTCYYKNFKTVSTGYPDYKGRYSYSYEVFSKQENGEYVKIKKSKLFNKNRRKLLSLINKRIKKDYDAYANEVERGECFQGHSFSPFDFEDMGIEFEGNQISFHVRFGLSSACMSADGTIVFMPLQEIEPYLNL